MPSAAPPVHGGAGITKFTNCRLLIGGSLVEQDLWISSVTGKIIQSQTAFYDEYIIPDQIIDLEGRIISPGFIECQLNGAFGFNFSTLFEDMSQYGKQLRDLNKKLIQTGVTSYVPTVTSQTSELYHKVGCCLFATRVASANPDRFFPFLGRRVTCRARRTVPSPWERMWKGHF